MTDPGVVPAATPSIRAARDTDADGLIALIGGVFAEYPGCVLDVDGEEPDLRAIASAYARRGGEFWVACGAEDGKVAGDVAGDVVDRVVGCVGWSPSSDAARAGWIELRKLYVAEPYRRQGLASALCEQVEAAARRRGAGGIELWSDTRFLDAHRFYARRGYQQLPGTRQLFDLSRSSEYHFIRPALADALHG